MAGVPVFGRQDTKMIQVFNIQDLTNGATLDADINISKNGFEILLPADLVSAEVRVYKSLGPDASGQEVWQDITLSSLGAATITTQGVYTITNTGRFKIEYRATAATNSGVVNLFTLG